MSAARCTYEQCLILTLSRLGQHALSSAWKRKGRHKHPTVFWTVMHVVHRWDEYGATMNKNLDYSCDIFLIPNFFVAIFPSLYKRNLTTLLLWTVLAKVECVQDLMQKTQDLIFHINHCCWGITGQLKVDSWISCIYCIGLKYNTGFVFFTPVWMDI